jgi:hypothetical protein
LEILTTSHSQRVGWWRVVRFTRIAEESRKTRGRLSELCGQVPPRKNRGRQHNWNPRKTGGAYHRGRPGEAHVAERLRPKVLLKQSHDTAEDSRKTPRKTRGRTGYSMCPAGLREGFLQHAPGSVSEGLAVASLVSFRQLTAEDKQATHRGRLAEGVGFCRFCVFANRLQRGRLAEDSRKTHGRTPRKNKYTPTARQKGILQPTYIHLSICPFIHLSIYPCIHLSIYPFI